VSKSLSKVNQNNVIKIDLPAEHVYLPILGSCIKTLLGDVSGLQQRHMVAYSTELAVYEACTNIVEHAYSNASGRIEVTITLISTPTCLVIDLVDYGAGFDISAVPMPDLDEPQVHGYGLFLVRELMDEVVYQPEAGRNLWRLVKSLRVRA